MASVERFPDTLKKVVQPMVDTQWQASGAAFEHFWQMQEKTLDAMETFMVGWFRRRHESAREAIRLVRDMAESEDMMEAATCVQEWMQESAARVSRDLKEAGESFQKLAQDSAPAIPKAGVRARRI